MTTIHETLKTYFGYDAFRPGQEKLITTLLSGRDVLGIMPTGAGKSLCYQIPALTFSGLTIVVSPLISLMQDQVQTLQRRGIRAEYINSAIPPGKRREILNDILCASKSLRSEPADSFQNFFGTPENEAAFPSALPHHTNVRNLQGSSPVKNVRSLQDNRPVRLLYVSPERLTSDEFRAFAKSARISFVCVDEAHCISQWGMQFRPDYLKIAEFVQMLPKRPVIGAFTATANTEVRDDIIDRLCLRNPYVLTTGFDRPNLFFEVRRTRDKWTDLTALLRKHRGECGIIYCLTRRTVESLSKKLCLSGFPVTHYHGGMSLADREKSQSDWLCGRRNVIVATNAFGMGIDKGDVRFVIHYNMPGCMENYYQEAGRAGRDGLPSDCIMLYTFRDVVINRFFISRAGILPAEMVKGEGHRSVSQIEGVYVAIDNSIDLEELRAHERRKLEAMQYFAGGNECLRAYMLTYFGEHAAPWCGKCSRCLSMVPFGKHVTSLLPDVESPELYEELRDLRMRIARREGVLPHKFFPNRVLHDLAKARPRSVPGMMLLEGIGVVSCLRYGREFVREIRIFVETN